MKKLYLLLLMLLITFSGWAQTTGAINIGGEPVAASAGSEIPISSNWGYNYSQQIVLKDEYTQNGGAGNITKIKWFVKERPSAITSFNKWKIYIGHTNLQSFSSTTFVGTSTSQLVADVVFTEDNFVAGQWLEITLTTPFNYDGNSNLLITVFEDAAAYVSGLTFAKYSTTVSSRGIYRRNDTASNVSNPPTSTQTGNIVSILPIIEFEGNLASCLRPSNITGASITSSGVNLSWTAPVVLPSNGYEYEVRTNTSPGVAGPQLIQSGSTANGVTTANVTGLTPNTNYNVYVRSSCGSDGSSIWSVVYSFKTECDASAIPYTVVMPTSGLPECFKIENLNSDTNLWTTSTAQTGITGRVMSLAANSTLASNDWFYTRGVQLVANQSYRLTFKYKKGTASANQKLKVSYGNNLASTEMTNQIVDVVFVTNSDAQSVFFDFIPSTSGVFYLGFQGYAAAAQGALYVGEIALRNSPNCFEPTNTTGSAITYYGIDLSWAAPSVVPSNGYEYEIRTDTNPGVAGAALTQSGSTAAGVTTASVVGLAPNTNYNVYVRSNCGAEGTSAWSVIYTFKTECDASAIPYIVTMPTSGLPECFKIENLNSDSNSWSTSAAQTGITGRVMSLSASSTLTSNDWFYTRGVQLVANQVYRLTFKVKKGIASGVQKLKVSYGTNVVDSQMTNQIIDVNFTNTTDAQNVSIDFIPNVTGSFYLGFQGYAAASQGTLYVGEIALNNAPSCLEPSGVNLTDVTKNSVKLRWTSPTILPNGGYEYEVRTSGVGGSGATGLYLNGTATSTDLEKLIAGLAPSTNYVVYLKSVCGVDNNSIWVAAGQITTLCNYPDLVSATGGSRCGVGTVDLVADYTDNSIVKWYSSATAGTLLHTGPTFTTPEINTTTNYYVQSGVYVPNVTSQVGSGTNSSASFGQSPFHYSYGGIKTQYIYTAQELQAAGLYAGEITSLAFNVATASSVNRNDFSIYIGNTTQTTATTTHVSGLTQVYANAAQPMTAGINAYNFTNPFVWDGVSNLVVQVSWSNINSGSSANSGGVLYHTTAINQATVSYGDNRTIDQILNTITGVPAGGTGTNGGTATYATRANTYFNGIGLCSSLRTEVTATVTTPPVLTLSTNSLEICLNTSQTVTVTAGSADYNNYVWSTSTGETQNIGVLGNEISGWTFNPSTSTAYVLKASQNSGALCSTELTLNVVVNTPLPMLDLADDMLICAGSIVELNVGDSTIWPSNYSNSFETTILQGFVKSSTAGSVTETISNTVASEGSKALKVTHGNNATGYITLQNSLDLSRFTQPYLTFDHIAALEAEYDFGFVEYSINGGSTWVSFPIANYVGQSSSVSGGIMEFSSESYSDWSNFESSSDQPTNAQWKTERFNLPTNVNLSNVKFRFKITSDTSGNYAGWFIDNVSVKNAPQINTTWLPIDNLYTDALATVPYTTNSNASKVYFKSNAVMAETDYTATVVSDRGCSTSQTVSISNSVANAPTASDQAFCGSVDVVNIVVGSETGATLKWFDSVSATTPITVINTSGTYYVSQAIGTCESTQTAVSITINARPDAPTGTSPQGFNEGQTVSSIVMDQANVTWYNSNADAQSGQNPLAQSTPLVNGTTYYGVIIGQNGCPSSSFELIVDVALGNEDFIKNELKYYPNPVIDILKITNSEKITQIEVFDLLGKRVKTKMTDDQEVNIDLSELASGTYMVQIKSESKTHFIKVIKK